MNAIKKAQEVLRQRREAGIKNKPPEHNLIKRYGLDTKSRKEAIHMMCFSCMGGDEKVMPEPGWKWHIRDCEIENCPLHKFRPYQ